MKLPSRSAHSAGSKQGLFGGTKEKRSKLSDTVFPESVKHATSNIVAYYAGLGSGKFIFRSKCSPNRLNTPQGTSWTLTRFLEVVNWSSDPNVP